MTALSAHAPGTGVSWYGSASAQAEHKKSGPSGTGRAAAGAGV